MSKTCKNCDHRKICEEWWRSDMYRDIKEMQKVWGDNCEHWNGWYDVKEEPPEKDKNVELLIDGESVGFGWLHNDCYYALWGALSSLTAVRKERVTHWRNLMEYEV